MPGPTYGAPASLPSPKADGTASSYPTTLGHNGHGGGIYSGAAVETAKATAVAAGLEAALAEEYAELVMEDSAVAMAAAPEG